MVCGILVSLDLSTQISRLQCFQAITAHHSKIQFLLVITIYWHTLCICNVALGRTHAVRKYCIPRLSYTWLSFLWTEVMSTKVAVCTIPDCNQFRSVKKFHWYVWGRSYDCRINNSTLVWSGLFVNERPTTTLHAKKACCQCALCKHKKLYHYGEAAFLLNSD